MPLILAAILLGAPAPGVTVHDCTGRGKSEGYPFGKQVDRTDSRFRVTADSAQVVVMRLGPPDSSICDPGAECASTLTGDLVELRVAKVPRSDPSYTERFVLNRKTLTFEAGGGGLDGGWSIAGRCTPAAP